jgi:hypothetical protein
MRQQYLTVKAWRVANPEKYREYQRAYMAKRRGKVAPVVQPAAAPAVKPEPVPAPSSINAPAVPVAVVSVPAEVAPVAVKTPAETAAEKMTRLLAAGRATVQKSPVVEPEPEPEPEPGAPYYGMTRREWKRIGPDRWQGWQSRHGLSFADESEHGEWLEGMPARPLDLPLCGARVRVKVAVSGGKSARCCPQISLDK